MNANIEILDHPSAEIVIAWDADSSVDYSYGGTRMVHPETHSSKSEEICKRLMWSESLLKNKLINSALREGALDHYAARLPGGFLDSTVGGARCIIKPKHQNLANVLIQPEHQAWESTISPIFEVIGNFLNQNQGKIKLTPDFGRFAGLADVLNNFTPHSLGIECHKGGCGGKSSYSATGIIAALEVLGYDKRKADNVTLIGSAGAMGSDVLEYLQRQNYRNLAVCDLVYDDPNSGITPPAELLKCSSKPGSFTVDCLNRGGLIIATSVGKELENSLWEIIPHGTIFLLAHNMAVPLGEAGKTLMQGLEGRDILAIPGQVLTLGGALTSRVEWFWRQSNPGVPFDKPLAHLVVADTIKFLVNKIQLIAQSSSITPYEAMLKYVDMETLMTTPIETVSYSGF
jgi:hypothetical protein